MSIQDPSAGFRPEFNLTAGSTRAHLIAVVVTCAVLWSIIAVTIGA